MSDELKPCPFCGGEPHIYQTSRDSDTEVQVQCKGCGAEIGFWLPWTVGDGQKAQAWVDVTVRWNPRADLADALAAALRSAQQSIADMMGVHGYPLDSGAGEILREVNAALAAWEARK